METIENMFFSLKKKNPNVVIKLVQEPKIEYIYNLLTGKKSEIILGCENNIYVDNVSFARIIYKNNHQIKISNINNKQAIIEKYLRDVLDKTINELIAQFKNRYKLTNVNAF